ncbi:MAG: hypothetical protein JW909_12440 [Planctomycetes bacterium]|nr:hypothetical protein [Planctomycetota bacterium]
MTMQKIVHFKEVNRAVVEERDIGAPRKNMVRAECIASVISPGTELAVLTGRHAAYRDKSLKWGTVPMDGGYCWAGVVTDPNGHAEQFPAGSGVVLPLAHANVHDFDPAETHAIRLSGTERAEEASCIPLAVIGASAPFAAPAADDSSVAVIGLGLIGQMCLQVYTRGLLFPVEPAAAVGFDLTESRVAAAKACGCSARVVAPDRTWKESFAETFPDGGPSIIVEATGSARVGAALMQGAPDFSTVVLLGSTREPVEIDLYKWIHRKALTVVGAHGKVMQRDGGVQKDRLEERLYSDILEGRLAVKPLITDRIRLAEAPEGYRRLIEEPSKHMGVLILP